ncbi:hypothetical protein JI721_11710 [Alicyclobacillus cycloheptanicus]|uniref:Uncharacterized protein n=1 Tax=Alicyclobacillus cycloheptanicus TaxID=1457 RepID=A0ABT9XFX9_9BACL|nr:hypothetical protein [Alicyclobacillus cycloheptanicus]MDQ0189205.1 hypothetical protein [Alicyclobacillus cycloheptanicus]WDM00390.1 hypothetical protein JI721_11710 [Alicyclobacillus cycloheptanicus]
MSTEQRHQTTLSELGFTVDVDDLPYLNEYPGEWRITGEGEMPRNFWLVTTDGVGHPVHGDLSPQQILDWGREQGWQCAYVAPYGRHVVGARDEIQLHDWLHDRKERHRTNVMD